MHAIASGERLPDARILEALCQRGANRTAVGSPIESTATRLHSDTRCSRAGKLGSGRLLASCAQRNSRAVEEVSLGRGDAVQVAHLLRKPLSSLPPNRSSDSDPQCHTPSGRKQDGREDNRGDEGEKLTVTAVSAHLHCTAQYNGYNEYNVQRTGSAPNGHRRSSRRSPLVLHS